MTARSVIRAAVVVLFTAGAVVAVTGILRWITGHDRGFFAALGGLVLIALGVLLGALTEPTSSRRH